MTNVNVVEKVDYRSFKLIISITTAENIEKKPKEESHTFET